MKVPASPPCRPRASSGSSASSAVECRKKSETRSSTARMRGDWRTNCTPTRIALMSRSRPERVGLVLAAPAQDRRSPRPRDSTALSANTQTLPALAISAPATSGPTMRDSVHRHAVERQRRRQLRCAAPARARSPRTPASAAPGRCRWRRSSASSSGARHAARARSTAHSTIGACRRARTAWRRASAAGRGCRPARRWAGPSRNTGSVEADCTSATQIGDGGQRWSSVHAAATSFIHMQMLAVSQVLHSMRNTGS